MKHLCATLLLVGSSLLANAQKNDIDLGVNMGAVFPFSKEQIAGSPTVDIKPGHALNFCMDINVRAKQSPVYFFFGLRAGSYSFSITELATPLVFTPPGSTPPTPFEVTEQVNIFHITVAPGFGIERGLNKNWRMMFKAAAGPTIQIPTNYGEPMPNISTEMTIGGLYNDLIYTGVRVFFPVGSFNASDSYQYYSSSYLGGSYGIIGTQIDFRLRIPSANRD